MFQFLKYVVYAAAAITLVWLGLRYANDAGIQDPQAASLIATWAQAPGMRGATRVSYVGEQDAVCWPDEGHGCSWREDDRSQIVLAVLPDGQTVVHCLTYAADRPPSQGPITYRGDEAWGFDATGLDTFKDDDQLGQEILERIGKELPRHPGCLDRGSSWETADIHNERRLAARAWKGTL